MDQVFLDNMLKSKIKPRTKLNIAPKTVPNNLVPITGVYEELTKEYLAYLFKLRESEYLIRTGSTKVVNKETFATILTIVSFKPRNNQEVISKDMIVTIILMYLMDKQYKRPKIFTKTLKDTFNQFYQFLSASSISSKEVK